MSLDDVFGYAFVAGLGATFGVAIGLLCFGGLGQFAAWCKKRDEEYQQSKAKGAATTAPNNETTEKQTNG